MKRTPLLLLVAALLAAGCATPGGPSAAESYPREVVGGAPWTALVVEVDHAPGYAPSEAAKTHLVSTLRNVTGKQEVCIVVEATLDAAPSRWTPDALLALEAETRSTAHEAPTALLHILYPAGTYERDGVAGVTITGIGVPPTVVFLDELRSLALSVEGIALPPLQQPQPALERLERSTLLHEAGHAMGLVNNGLPMVKPHEDTSTPEGARHSSNPESVMYWKVDSVNGLRDYLLDDGSVPSLFDTDDRADLRAAGGR